MRNKILSLTLGVMISTLSFAGNAYSSCEEETGLPECQPYGLSHCCVDQSTIPNVRCFGAYYPVKGADGHWHCSDGGDPSTH